MYKNIHSAMAYIAICFQGTFFHQRNLPFYYSCRYNTHQADLNLTKKSEIQNPEFSYRLVGLIQKRTSVPIIQDANKGPECRP